MVCGVLAMSLNNNYVCVYLCIQLVCLELLTIAVFCAYQIYHPPHQYIIGLPCISEVLLQNGATPFNPSTVIWTIQNYSDYLLLSFTKDDEGNINLNQHSYLLKREPRPLDPSIADIRLTLPVFFDGRIKLTVHYNESAYAGFTPISMESPLVTTSKPTCLNPFILTTFMMTCAIAMIMIY